MRFSVVASFHGINDDWEYWPCDVTYNDVRRACRECGVPFDETRNGDFGDYDYLIDEDDNVESRSKLLKRKREHPENGFTYWERARMNGRVLTVCTLMEREQFDRWIESLGAFADGTQTMGTLGGPLGYGLVADVNFVMESEAVIASIRATPCPTKANGDDIPVRNAAAAERAWNRLERAMVHVYGL